FDFIVADLDQGDVQLRLDGDQASVVARAVVEVNAQILRVEDVAVDGEDVAIRRDEDAAAVGSQTADAAGAEKLGQLWIDFLGYLGEGFISSYRRCQREGQRQGNYVLSNVHG